MKNDNILNIETINPPGWQEYELIDTGNREKLERFGRHILCRPEPQAVWSKSMSDDEWKHLSTARFIRKKEVKSESHEKGEWDIKKGMTEQWHLSYDYNNLQLKFRLGLTSFGHIGIFPEQADNWNYIYEAIQNSAHVIQHIPRVLNLFAYTGGSSLAAKSAGADVFHIDSVRQVVNWASENATNSNLTGIRWVVEDALKFVKREVKRGNKYNGIILDPPAYGRGPEGEKWLLDEKINELISYCRKLADRNNFFFVLSLYSMGYSPLIADNLINYHFGETIKTKEFGELYFRDKSNRNLPLGIFYRFKI